MAMTRMTENSPPTDHSFRYRKKQHHTATQNKKRAPWVWAHVHFDLISRFFVLFLLGNLHSNNHAK
jgi:hypothetical protein